jgi:hypothetical protein
MVDLGAIVGSLMSGLISARRMADEQTAALAEYYKDNPLLEGLSVPRIRIPELTIDLPMLIENYIPEESGKMENPRTIADEVEAQLRATLSKGSFKARPYFYETFSDEVENKLEGLKKANMPVMKETIARSVQDAFADTLVKTKTTLTAADKENVAKALREKVSVSSIAKEPVSSNIMANIKTADVKEKASNANVVRLKITLKEEGLEWATRTNESGGIVRTLQAE